MWFRVDDGFPTHPKTLAAAEALGGKLADARILAIWLKAGCYCAAYLTDGFVPDRWIAELQTDPEPMAVAEALVQATLWHRAGSGFRFHDWDDFQPSAQKVKDKRRKDRERKAALEQGSGQPAARALLPAFTEVIDGIVERSATLPDRIADDSAAIPARLAADSARIPERSRARGPVPSRSEERSRAEEPRARRALPAKMRITIWEVRQHLLAAVHRLTESGPPYLDAAGQPAIGAIVDEIKMIASRDLGATWRGRELQAIVDAALGRRAQRIEAELLEARFAQREARLLRRIERTR